MRSSSTSDLAVIRRRSKFNWASRHAAIQIQRIWRGFYRRKILWAADGILLISRVKKIQRWYRGCLGRKRAYNRVKYLIHEAANRIQCIRKLFEARRTLIKLRAARTEKSVIILQRHYRGRLARKIFLLILMKRRDEKCRY